MVEAQSPRENANKTEQPCKNLKKLKINPENKQHMINQFKINLDTKKRMARCKQTVNSTRPHRQEIKQHFQNNYL